MNLRLPLIALLAACAPPEPEEPKAPPVPERPPEFEEDAELDTVGDHLALGSSLDEP